MMVLIDASTRNADHGDGTRARSNRLEQQRQRVDALVVEVCAIPGEARMNIAPLQSSHKAGIVLKKEKICL